MSEVDRAVERAGAVLDRTRATYRTRGRKRREAEIARRLGRIVLADAAIIIAAIAIGWFMPLGMGGALIVMALLIATTLFFALFPLVPEPRVEKLAQVPLRALPATTEAWLDSQRPLLPAPAIGLVDQIGVRLDGIAPQLAGLPEDAPAAQEVRKLIGEQLPELIRGYEQVPQPLRASARHGRSPDQQLVEGLRLIDAEIGEMTEQLAQGALDQLATRERFLQIRYQGDEQG